MHSPDDAGGITRVAYDIEKARWWRSEMRAGGVMYTAGSTVIMATVLQSERNAFVIQVTDTDRMAALEDRRQP